jgi:hypothetical protein
VIPWSALVFPVTVIVLCAVGGFAFAWLSGRMADRSVGVVARGRPVTVPMLVTVNGHQRRGRAVLEGDAVRAVGKGVNVLVGRRGYESAAVRRGRLDAELLEYAEQRAFSDASGTRYLLGPVEEWEEAFTAALRQAPRPAGRLRLLLAATPRQVLAPLALAMFALVAFQGVWLSGHDVQASMVRVVGDEGLESCGVRWHETGRDKYAEVDCYAPFPEVGAPVRIRALAWPFDESAMDTEDTYPIASLLLGGGVVVLAGIAAGVGWSRMRRTPDLLTPLAAPATVPVIAPPATATVDVPRDASLPVLLDAVATREGWTDDGKDTPPEQSWYARYLMALGAGRWWPGVVMAGVALLVEDLPRPWRLALGAGAVVALGWAGLRALTAWLAIRRAYVGPVTSEWEYRLVRSVDDEWFALLFLLSTPHWMVVLDGPGHPVPVGRCGVRGDLEEGGAIQLFIHQAFWPTLSPVTRVDEALLADIRDDLVDRLRHDSADDDRPA